MGRMAYCFDAGHIFTGAYYYAIASTHAIRQYKGNTICSLDTFTTTTSTYAMGLVAYQARLSLTV